MIWIREAGAGSSNLLTPTICKEKGRSRRTISGFFRWVFPVMEPNLDLLLRQLGVALFRGGPEAQGDCYTITKS